MNKHQVEGRVKETAGKVQETAGRVVGSPEQELKGKLKKNLGKAQARTGDLAEDLKDADREDESGREDDSHR